MLIETPPPDLIYAEETLRREIQATGAEMFVSIRGSSFVVGTAALSKAREVSQLVADLREVNVAEPDILVESVTAEATSGVLGRNSSATYKLRIQCRDLARLADILGAVTAQKNASLDSLRWLYADSDPARANLLRDCLKKTADTARLIAESLGIRLIASHSVRYRYSDTEDRAIPTGPPAFPRSVGRARVSAEELGLQISHTKELSVTVTMEYRVSEIAGPAAG